MSAANPGLVSESRDTMLIFRADSAGICTDRLTPKQRRVWGSIEQIIQAVDRTGRPLHPKLFSLWQWAQTSAHTIYIEVLDEKHTTT